jgi:hypothetical protein
MYSFRTVPGSIGWSEIVPVWLFSIQLIISATIRQHVRGNFSINLKRMELNPGRFTRISHIGANSNLEGLKPLSIRVPQKCGSLPNPTGLKAIPEITCVQYRTRANFGSSCGLK